MSLSLSASLSLFLLLSLSLSVSLSLFLLFVVLFDFFLFSLNSISFPIEYFEQHLVAAHSKPWLKYLKRVFRLATLPLKGPVTFSFENYKKQLLIIVNGVKCVFCAKYESYIEARWLTIM